MKTIRAFTYSAIFVAATLFSSPATAGIKDLSKRTTKVDQLVQKVLGEQKLKPNGSISDAQFVRRIYLAAIGRIPTAAEASQFLADKSHDKRNQLIDTLLESEGYVSHFYNYWADVLRINRRLGRSGASNEYAYKHWVKESLRSNKPFDQMVYEMVSAEGNVWDNGATGYYHRDRGMPLDNMANTVRVFLGTRLECAQCHDHPFDKWSQKDFFKMASFTYGVRAGYDRSGNSSSIRQSMSSDRREKSRKIAEKVSGIKGFYPSRRDSDIDKMYASDDRRNMARRKGIKTAEKYKAINQTVLAAVQKYDRENRAIGQLVNDIYNPLRYSAMSVNDRDAKLPHDYQYDDAKPNDTIDPSPMFDSAFDKAAMEDGYLPTYAKWMTDKDNPQFSKVIANRLWKKAFGVGLVEPVDQFTEYTKPYNPELMVYLEKTMKDLDFDMKSFLAMLFKSKAWQRAAHTEEISAGAPFYFPGPALQRMSAEQIWDSLATLVIPDPDHYQPTLGTELRAIDRDKKIYDALESRTPEEFRAMVDELAVEVKASYLKQGKLREKYNQARKDEDEENTRTLARELRSIQNAMRRKIAKVAYNGADGRTRNMDSLMAGAGMSQMAGEGERYVRTSLPKVAIEVPKDLSKTQRKEWTRNQKKYSSSWRRTASTVMRASELPTPAPRGHFLREFGQSDRELIENANTGASVPQALNLMNSSLADMLRHPYSVLGQALSKCETPTDEIKTLYQLMLTRAPTESEIDRLLREYNSNGKKARNNVIWAMLNTQQFIFAL
jgi:hypothetical protein